MTQLTVSSVWMMLLMFCRSQCENLTRLLIGFVDWWPISFYSTKLWLNSRLKQKWNQNSVHIIKKWQCDGLWLHLSLVLNDETACVCMKVSHICVFYLWKMRMRSHKSRWETQGPLETPEQWRGQRGTYFSSYSPHFLNHPPHHPAARRFPILKFPQSFRCLQSHNAQMLSFGPLPPSNLSYHS